MAAPTLALACALLMGARGARPPPLVVPRCCPPGSELSPEALGRGALLGAEVAAACASAPDSVWAPRVYAPGRGAFLEPGRLPAHWRVGEAAPPACERVRVVPEHSAPYALLANNGSLWLRGAPEPLPAPRFCADARAALVCEEEASAAAGPGKCCPPGKAVDGASCVEAEALGAAALAQLRALANGTAVAAGHWPWCAAGRYAVAGALADARLNGSALELQGSVLAPGAWCADALLGEAGGARVLACEREARAGPGRGEARVRHALYGCGLAVGAFFLLLTLCAGCALPVQHRALHWRCQTNYVAALMLGDVLLAAVQLADDAVPPGICRALAVSMHFLFLAAFFWLNTMCFNIWWTFRDFRPTSMERGQEALRLRVYSLYAWGGPLALAAAAALLDALPGEGLLRPRFAETRCWFAGDLEVLVYFFGPVGLLLLVNLALFASTARQLTCGLWRRDEVKSTSERSALGRVCAKLVVVMGVTWGADVASWAAGGPAYLWLATDLLNALQGVLIFLVAGRQPHALAAARRLGQRARRLLCPCAPPPPPAPPCIGDSLTHTTAAKIPMETVC